MPRYPTPRKFVPVNPNKYVGDPNNIVCRSGIELRYMKLFDENPNVIKYSSEEFHIPYISPVDGKEHRYFPDFLIQVKTKTGDLRNILLEIKPSSDLIQPVKGKKKAKTFLSEAMTWEINNAKWKFAEAFCKKHNMKFMVVTEKEIKYKW